MSEASASPAPCRASLTNSCRLWTSRRARHFQSERSASTAGSSAGCAALPTIPPTKNQDGVIRGRASARAIGREHIKVKARHVVTTLVVTTWLIFRGEGSWLLRQDR